MEDQNKSSNFVDDKGNVYILGEFDSSISIEVFPKLVEMVDKMSGMKNASITFYINSYGGETRELWGLLTLISKAKRQGIKIYTVVLGQAYSAGSMLAVFGDHRVMWKYSSHCMHYGQAFSAPQTPLQNQRRAVYIKNHFNNIVELYQEHTKLSKEQVKDFMKDDDCYLSASDCLKYGLVDEVVEDLVNLENRKAEKKSVKKPIKKRG